MKGRNNVAARTSDNRAQKPRTAGRAYCNNNMRRWSYSPVAASILFCLLAWLFVPVLSHWRWRQDEIGGPQAGVTHTTSSRRPYCPEQLLADAKTLWAALRYICEPESLPSPNPQLFAPNTGQLATTNITGQGFSLHGA